MTDKEAGQDIPTTKENKDFSRMEGDDSRKLDLSEGETTEPRTSSSDDISCSVTQSSNAASTADAESSSSSSGIEVGSSRSDAAEGTTISPSTEICSVGQEKAGSSPDESASSSVPEVTSTKHPISTARQTVGSSKDTVASLDTDVKSESSSSVDLQPAPMDAECDISSTSQETSESSPDTAAQSELSSVREVQSESSPDVTQPETSSDDVVQPSSGPDVKTESFPDDGGHSELSTDTGVNSESSSNFEMQPESSPTNPEHQIISTEEQSESSSDTGVQVDELSAVSVCSDMSGTVTAERTILSSMDVLQKIPSTKETQTETSSDSGVVIPPLNENSLLRALLNKDRSPEADSTPPSPPHSDLPTEYSEADAEEMRAFSGNRFQQNLSSSETSRSFPVVSRSISFEEAVRELPVYPEEGDHVVPDVGGSWDRTPPGSYIPCVHEETTSDSLVSEQYTPSESYSPELQSTEEFAVENQELLDMEAVVADIDTLAAMEPMVQDPVVSTVPTVHELDVATVPTAEMSDVDSVPRISNPDATVPTASAAMASTVEESDFATVPSISNTSTTVQMVEEIPTVPKITIECDIVLIPNLAMPTSNPDSTVPIAQETSTVPKISIEGDELISNLPATVSTISNPATTVPMFQETPIVPKISIECDAMPISNLAATVSSTSKPASPMAQETVAKTSDDADDIPTISNISISPVKATKRSMPRSDDVSSDSGDSDFHSPAKKMAEEVQVKDAKSVQAATTSVTTVSVTETDSEETSHRGTAIKRSIEEPEAGTSSSQGPGFPSPTKKKAV